MKKLSILGVAAAMFGIGAMTQATTNVNPQNNVRYDKRNQNKESQPIQSQKIQSQKQVSQKVTKEKSKGYSMRPFLNQGIPPKIYGMHCVKRGTHKRTNV